MCGRVLTGHLWRDDVEVLFAAGRHGNRHQLGDGHRRGDEPRHRTFRESSRGVQRRGKNKIKYIFKLFY